MNQLTLDYSRPAAKSNEDEILDYLLHGNSLTTLEAWRLFHTSELRHYISRIIKRGYNVVGEWIEVNNKTKVKRYRIEK